MPRRPKTLLLVLWIAIQLVLAPVSGAQGCAGSGTPGRAGGGSGSCCGVATVPLLQVDASPPGCCCSDGAVAQHCDDAPQERAPEEPDGCDCSHAPAPEGLPEPVLALGGDVGPTALLPLRSSFVSIPRVALRGQRPPRTGPPGGAGRALHVRYCVFLI
jgi:hypothetical protein